MVGKFIGRIKYSVSKRDEYRLDFPHSEEQASLSLLCQYLDAGRSGVLLAESGRGRTYVARRILNQRHSQDNKKTIIFSLADYEPGRGIACLLPLASRVENLEEGDQVAVILDGYESLVSRKISLSSVIRTFRYYFQNENLPILLTCLPIDHQLQQPAMHLGISSEVFKAELQPMNADELDEYIRFELSNNRTWPEHSFSEDDKEYLKLVTWIEQQGHAVFS